MSGEELGDASPGAVLKRAREAQGAQLRDVAEALHLPIHVVDALERGDKSRLPAHVFTRGYVRAYAKLLELDPEALVTTLAYADGEPAGLGEPAGGPGFSLTRLTKQQQMIGAGVAGGIVFVLLLIAIFSGGDDAPPAAEAVVETTTPPPAQSAAAPATPTQTVPESQPAPVAATPASTQALVTEEAAIADPQPTGEPISGPSTAPAPDPEPVTEQAIDTAPIAGTSNARRLTPAGSDTLALEFTEDCWVEIKDGAGTTLFADLGSAGRKLEFVGGGPFRILLGYAPGAHMVFNAEPVALAPHTRNNVATLVIGQ